MRADPSATFTACPDCDLLVRRQPEYAGEQQLCPRCRALLWPAQRGPAGLALAAALSGLILFLPAVTLPIMQLNMVGQRGSSSLLGGVERLVLEGELALAILILLCSLVAPFCQLMFTAWVGLCLHSQRHPRCFPTLVRITHWMREWSMLEVYAVGALVAYIKMMDPGEVALATGAWCLAGLLVAVITSSQYFYQQQAWQHWAERPQ